MVGCLAREAISLEAFAIIFAITCQKLVLSRSRRRGVLAARSFKTKTPQQHRV